MLKRKIILITFLLFIFSPLSHTLELPQSGPNPIAVLTKFYSWEPCEGVGIMALYEDGTFLFDERSAKRNKCIIKYKKKRLTNIEIKALLKQLGPTEDFMSLNSYYDFTGDGFSDDPDVKIYLSDGKNKKAVTVFYDHYKKHFPKEFMRVYDLLRSIDRKKASEYIPEYYNVTLLPVPSYDSERKSIPWPKELPDLNDQYTVPLGGDGYSLIIPRAKYNEYDKYLEKLWKKDSDVLFDGKKYYIGDRPVFPYEDVWHDAFR